MATVLSPSCPDAEASVGPSRRRLAPSGRLGRLLTTDFCPWANRYVHWLKEPIGWFALAVFFSLLIGRYVSPVGWVMAAGLSAIVLVGLAWPYFVVRMARCALAPELACGHEGEPNRLVLTVHNRWPIPLWGLAVEGYLPTPEDEGASPNIALSYVPACSRAEYSLAVDPPWRGYYPSAAPRIACGFPFGLWTAARPLADVQPMKVWPGLLSLGEWVESIGRRRSDAGEGQRSGDQGEVLGVRGFRRGDRLRNVHWVQTARTGRMIVCERSAPQQEWVEVRLDTRGWMPHADDLVLARAAARRHLAWRVRIAASVALAFHGHRVPVRLVLGSEVHSLQAGRRGHEQLLDLMTAVPLDGTPAEASPQSLQADPPPGQWSVQLLADARSVAEGICRVRIDSGQGRGSDAGRGTSRVVEIDLNREIASQLQRLGEGGADDRRVA